MWCEKVRFAFAGFEDGLKGHKPRNAEAGKGKGADSPLEFPERKAALPTP